MYSSWLINSCLASLLTGGGFRVWLATSKPMRSSSRICRQFMYLEVSVKWGGNSQIKKVAPKPNSFRSGATTEYWLAVASSKVSTTRRSGICFFTVPENPQQASAINSNSIVGFFMMCLVMLTKVTAWTEFSKFFRKRFRGNGKEICTLRKGIMKFELN